MTTIQKLNQKLRLQKLILSTCVSDGAWLRTTNEIERLEDRIAILESAK